MSLEHYRPYLSTDDFLALQAEIERHLPPTIRLNRLKKDIHHRFADWNLAPIPFCRDGFQVLEQDSPLSQTTAYKMGDFFIQEAASMLPAELFSPHPNPLVLDMAAAPGGKSTHLVSRFGDRGLILANDSSRARLDAVKANLQSWGAMNVAISHHKGEQFGNWFPQTFDRILLDAPCSGDTLRPHKGNKTREVSPSEQNRLQQRQIHLLKSAFQALKVGGELVYSTCTLSPNENEAVIQAVLETYPQAVIGRVEIADLAEKAQGISAGFHPDLAKTVRLWNHLYGTSGFFAALLHKTDETPASPAVYPTRPLDRERLKLDEQTRVVKALREFGFDFAPILAINRLELSKHEGYIYALPTRNDLGHLTLISSGFLLGHWQDQLFIPSHELIARFEDQFIAPRLPLDAEQARQWWLGYDLRDISARDPLVLMEDEQGRLIGRGKVSGNRIRNLLPKRLIG